MKKTGKRLLFLTVVLCLFSLLTGCGGKKERFRSAKVIAVRGTATLSRGEDSFAVYEGLVLQSGDRLTTQADGRVDLKLDEDKFVLLEENTAVSLLLEGDPQKGAIILQQTRGTVHHAIENPLAEEDSYQVHTPDAVMAVRGTEFDTIVTQTDAGSQTETRVQEGNVEMTPTGQEESTRKLGPGERAVAGQTEGEGGRFLNTCPRCKQELVSQETHLLTCGNEHYTCDGDDHSVLPCGHLACATGDHKSTRPCGHVACAQGDHESTRPCGHPVCAEGSHEKLSCGDYVCASGHGQRSCGHCICDTGFESHDLMSCGHFACNSWDRGHGSLPCGYYACSGNGHSQCYGCGGCTCTGNHAMLACEHLACMGGTHTALPCGHFACTEGSHEAQPCGHYACDGKVHDAYLDCGNLLCADGHTACLFCGQCVCTGVHGETVCNPTG